MKNTGPIVIVSDTHSQESAWSGSGINGDALWGVEQVIQAAIEMKAIAVIGAGDLIDKQRNRSRPIQHWYHQIDQLEANGIPFYYIEGQHDKDDPPWLSGHKHACSLHLQSVQIGDYTFYGLNYTPAGQLQTELDNIPEGTDVLIAHQVWSDFMGDIARPQGSFADVPVVNMMFTGDLHDSRMVKTRGKDGQELLVFSPGATCMHAINEPTEHYFLGLYPGKKVKKFPLRSRPVNRTSLAGEYDLEEYVTHVNSLIVGMVEGCADLPAELHKPLLQVIYSAALPNVVARVERAVEGMAHLFWKEIPVEAEEKVKDAFTPEDTAVTPSSMLHTEVDPDAQPQLFSICRRMLDTNNYAVELAKWVTEFMKG